MWIHLLLSLLLIHLVHGDTYTSVDHMTKLKHVERSISKLVNHAIKLEEKKLIKLKSIKKSIIESEEDEGHSDIYGESNKDDSLIHPVKAFIKINKLNTVIENFVLLMEKMRFDSENMQRKLIDLDNKYNLPDEDDVYGSGEAILRLQTFYDLFVDDIIKGKLLKDNDTSLTNNATDSEILMSSLDCFEIGKIAFENAQYYNSIAWLGKTLDMIKDDINNAKNSQLIVDILDYMSFAAYRIGEIKYSVRLTKAWLERDPNNERAIENLAYYEKESTQKQSSELLDDDDDDDDDDRDASNYYNRRKNYSEIYNSSQKFNANDYEITEDNTVRFLCKDSSQQNGNSKYFCYKRLFINSGFLYPDIRIEQLHADPNIVRVYDIITKEESNYLRQLAKTRLLRSTVQSRYGAQTTEFRVAKTAWLSNELDPIIRKIEKRLSDIFQLDLSSSEDLQVVNYGLGGYYGPHLDSARETSVKEKNKNKLAISKLVDNDRLATILIYLNHVVAGGATVFPRLNLTVEPIERSAVFWYNININGLTDPKTLHTGCPVLMGSKWIATKWPRENENIFRKNTTFY